MFKGIVLALVAVLCVMPATAICICRGVYCPPPINATAPRAPCVCKGTICTMYYRFGDMIQAVETAANNPALVANGYPNLVN